MNTGRKRKGRCDRTHIIYQLEIGDKTYVGLTFVRKQSVVKTMRARIVQHWYNAHNHKYNWQLSEAIRQLESIDQIKHSIVGRVRGKSAAHTLERMLINQLKPKLNTDIR